jgi:UDP-N-acetyl-D-glucosamine dehydrogenase
MSEPSIKEMSELFVAKATERSLRIAIIGLGYVGLPLAMALHREKFTIIGVDVDTEKVTRLNAGENYIEHLDADYIAAMAASGTFDATTDFGALKDVDAILICVPTPLTKQREPDLSFICRTAENIAPNLSRGTLVGLESTTYPGTCEEVMIPILERSGLKAGADFAVCYSPEREDPGNPDFETRTIPKVVGAASPPEMTMALALYDSIVDTVPVSDLKTSEAVKLTENIFRSVNIALVNELKLIYGRMGIDVWEVIEAAKTKPFGFMPFYPGPGLGGHCIPIDPFYLSWKAREFGMSTRFIELAGEINRFMPEHVVGALTEALSSRLAKPVLGARILVVGMAYKKNVDDMRESPSLDLMSRLFKLGADVDYHDPHIQIIPETREHPEFAGMKSTPWTADSFAKYDAALISTDHDALDLELLLENIPLLIDTRNATASLYEKYKDKIVKA